MTGKSQVHIIAGPTATGKTSRALDVARKKSGIIINADSMQIYNELPMLSAQPSDEEKAKAPHRLYGVMEASERCDAQKWVEMVTQEIETAHNKGHLPIIVGGTGLYIKALTEGFSPIPNIPEHVRESATKVQHELGNPAFHAELAQKDPAMAKKLHPNDTQRLVRAWEVLEHTGKSLAEWQALPPENPSEHLGFSFEILTPDREALYERCNTRFDLMIKMGVLDEVEELDNKIQAGTVPADAAITHALGFHPLQSYLHGEMSLENAIELSKTETRQYAKRQTTWFKNQLSVET